VVIGMSIGTVLTLIVLPGVLRVTLRGYEPGRLADPASAKNEELYPGATRASKPISLSATADST
jgi:hypothetical protein